MNCFNHTDRNAIGLCKFCSEGLCHACTTDLEHGLACKDKHENQVKDLDMVITKNIKVYASASKNSLMAPLFYFFASLVFAGFGYFSKSGVFGLPLYFRYRIYYICCYCVCA